MHETRIVFPFAILCVLGDRSLEGSRPCFPPFVRELHSINSEHNCQILACVKARKVPLLSTITAKEQYFLSFLLREVRETALNLLRVSVLLLRRIKRWVEY